MGSSSRELRAVTTAATLAAGAMIAHQVGAKATRDAFFLSNYDVEHLPTMLIVASIVSIAVVLLTSSTMQRVGPGRFVPRAFVASGVLLLGEWGLSFLTPAVAAIVVYLHIASFGAILISAFWSLVNELFDPRTGKKAIGRIGAGGTFGGLVGGVLAERAAVYLSVTGMLPVLAALHLFCAWGVVRTWASGRRLTAAESALGPEGEATEQPTHDLAAVADDADDSEIVNGLEVLLKQRYLRNLAVLVLLGTVAAALIDYVFKAEAAAAFDEGESLLRFFAVFYAGVGLFTFVVQWLFAQRSLKRLGLARTVGTLPMAAAVGGVGALVAPGLASASLVRGAESTLRSSLYRSGYELLYTPIPAKDKRATKQIVDVGFDRLGDAVGGGITKLILVTVAAGAAHSVLLALAVGLSGLAILITRRLHRGYVRALEKSLLTRAVELDIGDLEDSTTRSTLLQTMGTLDIREALQKLSIDRDFGQELGRDLGHHLGAAGDATSAAGAESSRSPSSGSTRIPAGLSSAPSNRVEPVVQAIVDLRSGDPERIRAALGGPPIEPALVPHVLPLLAWDEIADRAAHALRRVAKRITGQLVDALLDPDEEFAIRRRIPRVLCWARTQRATDGLLLGLDDKRFEVRFQSGRGLAYMIERESELVVERERIFGVVRREAQVDRRVWESHRLLDQFDDDETSLFVDEFLRDRSNRSLEHVFTLLALVLPRQPLKIAYRGLHTTDVKLRGTALEYLESVLPADIRESLWPFLEGGGRPSEPVARGRDDILADLMRSNKSIQLNLEALRQRFGAREPGGPEPESE